MASAWPESLGASLGASWPAGDPRPRDAKQREALRRSAVLTLSRRATIGPKLPLLVEDAVALTLSLLDAPWGGISQIIGGELWTRLVHVDRRGKPSRWMACHEQLHTAPSIVGLAIQRGRVVTQSGMQAERHVCQPLFHDWQPSEALAMPIFLDRQAVGVLSAFFAEPRGLLVREDLEFVESLCGIVSTALGRAWVEEELQQARSVATQAVQILRELGIEPPQPQTPAEVLLMELTDLHDGPSNWPNDIAAAPPKPIQQWVAPRERRSNPRMPYPYVQLIAPVTGGVLPGHKAFFPVECVDICAGGISFLVDTPPDFEELVIELGHPPKPTYLMARVAHTRQIAESQDRFLVGCRFTGRLEW